MDHLNNANVNKLYGHVLPQLYLYNDAHLTFVWGDIDERKCALNGIIDLDAMSKRYRTDKTVHGHGESLINASNSCYYVCAKWQI